jgi:CheY-like chemotaxis protein
MNQQNILLVEDNDDDIFLMRRALQKAKLTCPLQVVTDGQQALDYLKGLDKYADRLTYPLPDVIFLDLKLPYVHGFDVLAWIRQDSVMKELPVIVLTSSSEDRDRQRAAELHAKNYLVKPPTSAVLIEALQACADLLAA